MLSFLVVTSAVNVWGVVHDCYLVEDVVLVKKSFGGCINKETYTPFFVSVEFLAGFAGRSDGKLLIGFSGDEFFCMFEPLSFDCSINLL